MPAVELNKLHTQLQDLAETFARPEEFMRALRDFLEKHADNGYRAGARMVQQPVLPSYRLPALVSRRLELELVNLTAAQPEKAFAIIDGLWRETYNEPRQYATLMLGQIPLRLAEGTLERLNAWANPEEDRAILDALLDKGTQRIRHEGSDALLEIYEAWLLQTDPARQAMGLKAILALVNDREFENIPPLFGMLFPLMRTASASIFNELAAVLTSLAKRTPTETVYFLRQILSSPTSPNTSRLARRILPDLTPELQENLKAALRAHGSTLRNSQS